MTDARTAFRSLKKRPGMSAAAVLSLAFGIGATSSLFSVVDALYLRPIPLPDSRRLVALNDVRNGEESGGNPERLRDLAAQAPAFASIAGFYGEGMVRVTPSGPKRAEVLRTFGDIPGVLGVSPVRGRALTGEEWKGGGEPVAIATAAYWKRLRQEGQSLPCPIKLDRSEVSVVGVLPESAGYPEGIDLVVPAPRDLQEGGRKSSFLRVIGRLAPGVTLPQAQAQLDAVMARLAAEHPATDKGLRIVAADLQSDETRAARKIVWPLFAAVGFVLLLAVVNVAGLLLVHGVERRKEFAIRAALGAGRGALARLALWESLWTGLAGAGLGLFLAESGIGFLRNAIPANFPLVASIALDARVAAFAVTLGFAGSVLAGLLPMFQSASTPAAGSSRSTASKKSVAARRWLVAAQAGLAMLLLVCATLASRSLAAVLQAPTGIRAEQLLTLEVNYPWTSDKQRLDNFERDSLQKLESVPGIRAAAVLDRLPLEGGAQSGPLQWRGHDGDVERQVSIRGLSPSSFATLGTPLLAGRGYRDDGRREVVINERLARTLGGNANAIGQSISFAGRAAEPVWYEVVGVVPAVREQATENQTRPQVFVSRQKVYWPMMRFVIRTQANTADTLDSARSALFSLDQALPLVRTMTMVEALGAEQKEPRLLAFVMAGFAVSALLLALIGLYGLMTSEVAGRTREIGIRLALGASPRGLATSVLRRGLLLTGAGALAGIAAATGVARLLESVLFGVRPWDALSFAFASALLMLCAAAACGLPARRAARVDPAVSLRQD